MSSFPALGHILRVLRCCSLHCPPWGVHTTRVIITLRGEKLAKGVSTLAERKWVSEVLTVLKHALFKAITIAAGGGDPDDGNQVCTYTEEA